MTTPDEYSSAGYITGRHALMPFKYDSAGLWVAKTLRPFTPHGLAIWAPDGAWLKSLCIPGLDAPSDIYEAVPARFFGMGRNFAQLAKLVLDGVEPPTWLQWPTVTTVDSVRLELEDSAHKPLAEADAQAVMWGIAIFRTANT